MANLRKMWHRAALAAVIVLVAAVAGSQTAVKTSASAIAITRDGSTVMAVNPDSDSMSILDTGSLGVVAEMPVGRDPRSVAVDRDGRLAFVANRGSGTISVLDMTHLESIAEIEVGHRPYGVVTHPDDDRVFVTLQGDDRIAVIGGSVPYVVDRIDVAPRPSGIAVSHDGSRILVTHLLSGRLTVIDASRHSVTDEIALYPDSNLLQSVVWSPLDSTAYVPHTRSNSENPVLTFDTTVFPLVSRVDTTQLVHLSGRHISLDTIDPPGVGLPFDAAVSPMGDRLYVVNAASNDVTVVDLALDQLAGHIEVGDNPRGIVLSPDGTTAYVNNTLAGTISVIDTNSNRVTDTVAVTAHPAPPAFLEGKRLFNSSHDSRLARSQWIACSSCHFDGEHDGRTWLFGFAGPRNTTDLRGMVQSYPLRWSAEWDEAADTEFAITEEQFGSGLLDGDMHEPLGQPNGGRMPELDRLGAYLDSLQMPQNPHLGSFDPEAVARGRALFEDPIAECAQCHPSPYFTDFQRHDVGTAEGQGERLGPEIDTPTLRNLAASAPYLHDGSAATLRDVLTDSNGDDRHGVTSHLTADELMDLEIFMLAIAANNHACRLCDPPAAGARATRFEAGLNDPPSPRLDDDVLRRPTGRYSDRTTVSGRVMAGGAATPAPGALVTIRASEFKTTADAEGRFSIQFPATTDEVEVTAWAPGHYVASAMVTPPSTSIELNLRHHHARDHASYRWLDPFPDPETGSACGNCHPTILPQWSGNAHGGAVTNPRFYSFYNGTDISGTRPVEPGYLLDFPGTTGNCATCHAPGAALDAPFATDMNTVRGDTLAGIHCDFCHKVGGAYLRSTGPRTDPCGGCHPPGYHPLESQSREPYPNMPGVLSLRLLRPPDGEQIFLGPYPDVHDPDAYLPLMRESAFCAPCHQFSFWGTPVYTSYGEWLSSPYADRETGLTCQGCHMPPTGDTYFALPDQGGVEHPPETIPSHLQLGANSLDLLRNTIELVVDVFESGGVLDVEVTVTNSGAGHHVPTDHPGRNMLLVLDARDGTGSPLELLSGTLIPGWGGDLVDKPGVGFAKLLEDVQTGDWPVVSYWKPTLIRDDTRLPALASSTTSYVFAKSPNGGSTITATVVYRRMFFEIAERYEWPLGEVVMGQAEVTLAD